MEDVLVGEITRPAPENQPRKHVANNRPKGICLSFSCPCELPALVLTKRAGFNVLEAIVDGV
jgi:hypothetical protein